MTSSLNIYVTAMLLDYLLTRYLPAITSYYLVDPANTIGLS